MYGNWLYYISRDNFLISLDATTGQAAMDHACLRSEAILFFYDGADRNRRSRDHRNGRRFARSFRICAGARPGNRRNSMDPLQHSARRRARHRNMAGCIRLYPRRRRILGSRRVRSRTEFVLLRHCKSKSRLCAAEPQGRGSLHVLDNRDQSGYRENGVVFPGFSARHARLGCGMRYGVDRRHD